MVSAVLSWLAILTEFVLIPLLLVPRFVPLGIFVGVCYHTGLVLITGGNTFDMFWYAMIATYVTLVHWPIGLVVNFNPERRLHRIAHSVLACVDPEKSMAWHPQKIRRMEIEMRMARFTGVAAMARILLYTPAFYLACLVLFTRVRPYGPAAIPLITYALLIGIGYSYVPWVEVTKARLWRRAPSKTAG
jgi:hypothetical protein